MSEAPTGQSKGIDEASSGPLRVTLIYVLVAGAWILLSGHVVAYVARTPEQLMVMEEAKGLVFVLLTSIMLFILISKLVGRVYAAHQVVLLEQNAKIQALRLLEVMTEQTLDAIYVKDLRGRYLLFNRQASQFVGKNVADVLGKDDFAIFSEADAHMVRSSDQRVLADGCASMFEETLNTASGIRSVLTIKGPVYDDNHNLVGLFGVTRDITDQKLADQALRQSEAQYRSLFQNMLGGFAYCKVQYQQDKPVDAEFLAVNTNFTPLTGLDNVVGKTLLQVLPQLRQSDPLLLETVFRVVQSGKPEQFEVFVKALNKWMAFSVFSTGHFHFALLFDDITDRKMALEKVEFLAYHDHLTGLPNRFLAADHMQMAMARADRTAGKAALLFVDLDNFKAVNDSANHQLGDLLLTEVGERFRCAVRDTDTVSRQSSDEFLVVLSDLSQVDEAAMVAEKILRALDTPFQLNGRTLSITASIGIALYPDDGQSFETLLKNADSAMAHAKEIGRNVCHAFDPSLNVDSHEQFQIYNDLTQAVELNQFELYYQPQEDLATGQVVGAEALIRWHHPEQGLIPPGRFIPVAEERGLIIPMGEWVLQQACRQIAAWDLDGLENLVIAVNLSALQFKRGNLVETVDRAIRDAGISPARLELELTESILIKDVDNVLATVERLKDLGVQLSIDDFGTGYSSLSYLRRFKVDKLKIDQSFVRDLLHDPEDAIIVRTIIQMAKALNLRTIAEGVETEAIRQQLHLLDCHEAQGYHFARPMPAGAFADFVRPLLRR